MKMYIDGQWRAGEASAPVTNPYDNSVVDEAPLATPKDVEDAVASASLATSAMREMPIYRRSEIIEKAARLLLERKESIARLITLENGKTINEARGEIDRAAMTLFAAADAAREIGGETLPLSARQVPAVEKKFGFTFRVPCGVVLAITPFNVPINLACHKIGAAFAAGNSVILKSASDTPLSTVRLVEAFLDAGLPETAIQYITGSGSKLGAILCPDKRIRKITFTGSFGVGEEICRLAGLKKVTMELGGNCPVIVMDDADPDNVVNALLPGAYGMAGQACVSTQRVLVHESLYETIVEGLASKIDESFTLGDPMDEATTMGPLIRESDARRVSEVIDEARSRGARVLGRDGGQRNGNFVNPAVVADVRPTMRMFREELFGPAAAIIPFKDRDAAIAAANDTNYGLAAGVFTRNLDDAMYLAARVDSGIMHINSSSRWRVDHMPNGGIKDSGMGKEGPKYAIEELSESRTVIMHLQDRALY